MSKIHPSAIVEKGAELASDVEVGPYCVVGPQVKIASGTKLMSHVILSGRVSVGERNVFHPFCVIGGDPQDVSYKAEDTEVQIGDENIFREFVTVSKGTMKDHGLTKIASKNFFMAQVHIAHDCIVGNQNIFVNGVNLAGHVEIGSNVVLSGVSNVVQKCRVGDCAFVAAASILRRDLPPFMIARGDSEVVGPNLVGIKRRGFSESEVKVAKEIYKIFYLGHQTAEQALQQIDSQFPESQIAREFLKFVKSTKAGVQR